MFIDRNEQSTEVSPRVIKKDFGVEGFTLPTSMLELYKAQLGHATKYWCVEQSYYMQHHLISYNI